MTIPRLSLAVVVLWLAGCAQQQRWNEEVRQRKLARQGGAAQGLIDKQAEGLDFCLAPAQATGNYPRTYRWKVDYARLGLKEASSVDATEGCDVVLVISHAIDPWKASYWTYEARSARTKDVLWSGNITNTWGVGKTMPQLVASMHQAFGAGTEVRRRVAAERRRAGVVSVREKVYAAPERQAQVEQAERDGDAAAQAGDKGRAFKAYTDALTGPYSDDEASRRVRNNYMKLLASYRNLPEIPEEARRHMVRAKAVLKDARSPDAYDQAAVEMVRAIEAAPWWSSAYYNLGLVAEKQGRLYDAIGCLKLYLLANPQAPDAQAVQDKIYGLEVRAEQGAKR